MVIIIPAELFILQEPYVYFVILGLCVGVGLIIFRKVKLDKGTRFIPQSLSEVVINENFKPYVNTFGDKLKNGKLYTQYKNISIRRKAKIHLTYYIKEEGKMEKKEGIFIIFKTGKSFLSEIPILNKLADKSEYIIINKNDDVLIKDKFYDKWTTTDNVFFYQFAGLWICSKESQNFITEMINKKMLENEKEEGMNYIKRIVFYNDQYAQRVSELEQQYVLEKEKWKDRLERETGIRKKE